MKKIITILLAAVLLVSGGFAGITYAQVNGHEPMTGQKLVGQGTYTEWEDGGILNYLDAYIILTNPDCVSEITIERISVFTYDGILVYEDSLRVKVDGGWEEYTDSMKPHQTLETVLSFYDLPGGEREVDMIYTVEIFWTWTDKKGLPLTGWVSGVLVRQDNGAELEFAGVTQMVNMKQRLES